MANVPGHDPSMTPLKFCIVVLNIVLLPRESERERVDLIKNGVLTR